MTRNFQKNEDVRCAWEVACEIKALIDTTFLFALMVSHKCWMIYDEKNLTTVNQRKRALCLFLRNCWRKE